MIIVAINPSTQGLESTSLTDPVDQDGQVLDVKSNEGFIVGQPILIGDLGDEQCEIAYVDSKTGQERISLASPLQFSHGVDVPVYQLLFDQAKFFRSTNGVDGQYDQLVGSPKILDVASPEFKTIFDDTDGQLTYFYKVALYNSVSLIQSDYSDPIPGSGFTSKTVGKIIDDMLDELDLTDGTGAMRRMMMGWMNEVNDDLETRTTKPYSWLKTREVFARTANAATLAFPVDSVTGLPKMWAFEKLEYRYYDSTTDPVTNRKYEPNVIEASLMTQRHGDLTYTELDPEDNSAVNDRLVEMSLDETIQAFRYWPVSKTAQAAVFYLYYWKYLTRFTGDADVVETPGTKLYRDYIRAKHFRRKASKDNSYLAASDRYMGDYETTFKNLQRANRKDQGSPRQFGFYGGKTYKGFKR
jgi:hypothetical protein